MGLVRNTTGDYTPPESTDSDVLDAAELGRRATLAQAIDPDNLDAGLIARVLRSDERLEVRDLEYTLAAPHACRGAAVIYDPQDFVSYVNRLADAGTTVWADPDHGTVVAVFDDHANGESPGWRRHRATLELRIDDDWRAWFQASGRLTNQEAFAEFIEDNLAAVVDPEPATMLEIATSFQARRNASFERGTRLQTGDVQLRWVETTTATAGSKGHLEVPEKSTVRLAPYVGVAAVELDARLRYRITDGHLRIGYALHRPDNAVREAFDRIRAIVAENVRSPIHLGEAPAQLHREPRSTSPF